MLEVQCLRIEGTPTSVASCKSRAHAETAADLHVSPMLLACGLFPAASLGLAMQVVADACDSLGDTAPALPAKPNNAEVVK